MDDRLSSMEKVGGVVLRKGIRKEGPGKKSMLRKTYDRGKKERWFTWKGERKSFQERGGKKKGIPPGA